MIKCLQSVAGFSGANRIFGSRLAGKVAGTYAARLLQVAAALLTSVLVARQLGPEGRGVHAIALAIGALGIQITNLGLHSAYTYHVARQPRLLGALIGNVIALVGGAITPAVLTILFVARLAPRIAPVHGVPLILGLVWIPLGLAYLLFQNLLVGVHNLRAFNLIETVNKVLTLATVVVLMGTSALSINSALLAAVTVLAGCTVWAGYTLARGTALRIRPSLSAAREVFGFAIRSHIINLLGFLVLRVDLLLIQYYLGAANSGLYAVALNVADCILLLPAVAATVVFPRICALEDSREGLRQARNTTAVTALALLPAVLSVVAFGPRLIILVLGPKFSASTAPMLALLPGVFLIGIETVLVQWLNSRGMPRSLIVTWAAVSVLSIALKIALVQTYGIVGVAIATSVSHALVFVAILWLTIRHAKRLRTAGAATPTLSLPSFAPELPVNETT